MRNHFMKMEAPSSEHPGHRIHMSRIFGPQECRKVEFEIEKMFLSGIRGMYSPHTVSYSPLMVKLFFGEGYFRGDPGGHIYPRDELEPIPEWVMDLIEKPIVEAGILPPGFLNSLVVNVYLPIKHSVAHVELQKECKDPVVGVSLLHQTGFSFLGCYFSDINSQHYTPVPRIPLDRGTVFSIPCPSPSGFSYFIHPEATSYCRSVLILRHIPETTSRLTSSELSQRDLYPPSSNPLELSDGLRDLVSLIESKPSHQDQNCLPSTVLNESPAEEEVTCHSSWTQESPHSSRMEEDPRVRRRESKREREKRLRRQLKALLRRNRAIKERMRLREERRNSSSS